MELYKEWTLITKKSFTIVDRSLPSPTVTGSIMVGTSCTTSLENPLSEMREERNLSLSTNIFAVCVVEGYNGGLLGLGFLGRSSNTENFHIPCPSSMGLPA